MTNSRITKTGPNTWRTILINVGDGSGDAILELPREVVNQWGLKEGDAVELNRGSNGEIVITKKGA